jgi:hypothetical protein
MANRSGKRFGWRELLQRRRKRAAFTKGLEELKMLVKATAVTEDSEIGCDEAYDSLDQFAEIVARGEDPTKILPQVKKHLDMCGNCREEFEALLRILKAR